ncbi:hypothetical protein [Streptococcus saliviloxodontae]|uniref:ATP-binding protein n=1 Tax=Streptococcus saliviloxodontae TaxID=1349416 RepID=A0ABS2PJH0_9STRE|nr:hypothetical protein [Streptococcus saliviloxodontae]MBM7635501.1 hypothetical protein [Streptococcus saliviloxodontae]
MIIFAFPGIGKTSLAKKYDAVVDLELSEIKYDNSGVRHLTKEERKSLKRPLKSKDYKEVYVAKALDLHKEGYLVLVALNFLPRLLWHMGKGAQKNCHIFIPKLSLRKEYRSRYQKRGNNRRFIFEVMSIWYPTLVFLSLLSYVIPGLITILESNEFLEDFFDSDRMTFKS